MRVSKLYLLSLFISFNISCYEDYLEDFQELTSPPTVGLKEVVQINLSDQNYTVCSRIFDDKARSRVIVILVCSNSKSESNNKSEIENQANIDQYRAYDYNGNFLGELPINLTQTSDFASMPGNSDLLILSCRTSPNVLVWDLKNNKEYGTYLTTDDNKTIGHVSGLGPTFNLNLFAGAPQDSVYDSIYIWDLNNQSVPVYIIPNPHSGSFINFLGRPDNSDWFASSNGQGEIKTWDFKGNQRGEIQIAPSSSPMVTDPRKIIKFLDLYNNGNPKIPTIVCGTLGAIQLYDQTGKLQKTLTGDFNNSQSLEINNDFGIVISATSNKALVWDPFYESIHGYFNGSLQTINDAKIIIFSPANGNAVVITASGTSSSYPVDNSVRVWDFNSQAIIDRSTKDPDVASVIVDFGNNSGLFMVVAGSYLRFFQLTSN